MLATSWQGFHRTMSPSSFRLAIVVAVVVVSILGVIAFATVIAGELTDRSVLVLGVILGFLGPTIVSLLNLLKSDQVSAKVEDVHHDILNGGLRNNVHEALRQAADDPYLQERRIDITAKGVQRDRHRRANRDTITQNQPALDELRHRRKKPPESEA